MKKLILLSLVCFAFYSSSAQTRQGEPLDVTWFMKIRYNDSLSGLPWLLLHKMDEGKIKAYDSTGTAMSSHQVQQRIGPDMKDPILTWEECYIIFSHTASKESMKDIETKYSAKQLHELLNQGEDLKNLIQLKYNDPFDTKVLELEIQENVLLDTTVHRQMGTIQWIRFLIPEAYSASHRKEVLCQFNYQDVKKLKLYPVEALDRHDFQLPTANGDLTIHDGKTKYRLSSLRQPLTHYTYKAEAKKYIFNYFSCNILFNESVKKVPEKDDCH